jgi:Uncharacterised nucleotidyltransferase
MTIASLDDAFKRSTAALRESGIPFAVGGSVACWARGGPEAIKDLDFFVKPEDADAALQALADAGLRTERPPEEWLYKAYDGDALVDLIFEPEGLDVDDELFGRCETLNVLSLSVSVMALEDVLTTKLLALQETYLEFGSLLQIARSLREKIDWDMVRSRTTHSPFARAFFYLAEELEIVAPAPVTGRSG